jgi:prophage regulatory protein
MSRKIISYTDLRSKGIPLSKPQLWRLEKDGKFPKRVPISLGRYGYVEEEIDAYIDSRIRARDQVVSAAV